jgi:hypothetical protein
MPEHFVRTLDLPVPAAVLWAFHAQPDAFRLLVPPWERIDVLEPPRSLEVGTRVVLRRWVGPVPVTLRAEHVAHEPGRMFADRMVGGPFAHWLHRHVVEPTPTGARLTDDIEYELRGGALGRLAVGKWFRRQLERMFDHRHAVTRRWCEAAMPRA